MASRSSTLVRQVTSRPGLNLSRQFAAPTALLAAALTTSTHRRAVAVEKLTPEQGMDRLAAQRLNRPVSPHLSIYKVEQTFFTPSIWHRITGGLLTGSLYAASTAYLVAPVVGWHLESASLVAAVASWPVFVKAPVKFALAWPVTYHFFNGIRHLLYDYVVGFQRHQIKNWAWVVWSSSLASALYLAFGY